MRADPEANTEPDRPARHFLLAFVIALILYAIVYRAIEHRRVRKGPWQVTFTSTAAGAPALVINQPALKIANVQVVFDGQSAPPSAPSTLVFGQPRPVPYDVPFGKCLFMDTTFLPGTVSFALLGHEVELLPRVLVIDRQEHPWQSGTTLRIGQARQAAARRCLLSPLSVATGRKAERGGRIRASRAPSTRISRLPALTRVASRPSGW